MFAAKAIERNTNPGMFSLIVGKMFSDSEIYYALGLSQKINSWSLTSWVMLLSRQRSRKYILWNSLIKQEQDMIIWESHSSVNTVILWSTLIIRMFSASWRSFLHYQGRWEALTPKKEKKQHQEKTCVTN